MAQYAAQGFDVLLATSAAVVGVVQKSFNLVQRDFETCAM